MSEILGAILEALIWKDPEESWEWVVKCIILCGALIAVPLWYAFVH